MQIKCTKHQTHCFLTRVRRENRQKRKVNSLISRLSICTSFAGELQRKNPTSPKRILHYLAKRAIGVTPVSSTLILRWFGFVFILCSASGLSALVKGKMRQLLRASVSLQPNQNASQQQNVSGGQNVPGDQSPWHIGSLRVRPFPRPNASRDLTPWHIWAKTAKTTCAVKNFSTPLIATMKQIGKNCYCLCFR